MINPITIQDRNWTFDYSKYELSRRNNIIIVSSIYENISAENTELFIRIINSRYCYKTGDVAPYHYYVDVDGTIYKTKEDTLKLNPVYELKSFENDLIIMIMNTDITKITDKQRQSLIELLGELSNKYRIAANRISFYPELYADSCGSSDIINSIIKDVIKYKNTLNKLNSICENSDGENPNISDYIGLIRTNENCYTINDLSVKFNVSEDILIKLNPHITGDFTPGQLIFYPKTISSKVIELSDYFKKHSDKYYMLSKTKLEG
ncbi:MAG: N-acetylmuramoyl-L-alanine amidase [Clostridia bacterium]|nr:N-acetylmuramoyl-L-alanine amidase [Clostridia bacterium]